MIIDRAQDGQYQFVKLALELVGRYNDRITITSEAPQIGIEHYQGIIKTVAQWEAERFGN